MIVFENVTKQFSDRDFGLKDVSFHVDPGEFVFITGSSGSGKTTLMRLLTKEYSPSAGEVFFDQQPLSQVKMSKIHTVRRKLGVVFQDYKLLPELNVWENISLPLYIVGTPEHEVEQRVSDLLRLVGIPEKASLFPSQLSGGEAQRVSIARALTTGPSVIFADEPTGNLDPETSLTIASLFEKINNLGTTILFATHNHELLDHLKGKRRIHLENGELTIDSAQKKSKKNTAQSTTSDEAEEIAEASSKPGLLGKLFGRKKSQVEQEPIESQIENLDDTTEEKEDKKE